MVRLSNNLVGILNFLTFLLSSLSPSRRSPWPAEAQAWRELSLGKRHDGRRRSSEAKACQTTPKEDSVVIILGMPELLTRLGTMANQRPAMVGLTDRHGMRPGPLTPFEERTAGPGASLPTSASHEHPGSRLISYSPLPEHQQLRRAQSPARGTDEYQPNAPLNG